MKLIVTILEETFDAAIDAIRALRDADHDGVELRAEKLTDVDLRVLRESTSKAIILTHRGRFTDFSDVDVDWIDVEWHPEMAMKRPERVILSHHDYAGMHDVEAIVEAMRVLGPAHTKLAATPHNFADNERLLRCNAGTIIGMGERGLYARILAPFRGSEFTFVGNAAPGQIDLERALKIFGPDRESLRADKVFAIVGNPAGHSLSPSIHNPLFRSKGVSAAYTIASIERFDEITNAFLNGEPCGVSVTAPFKEDAFAFAGKINATIGENAMRARAVNTLVNLGDEVLADNTDVDGFSALLPQVRKAAIVGAGGTSRAAQIALEKAGIAATVYNRTTSKGEPLDRLRDFDGELIVNTLPSGVDVDIPRCEVYLEAAYGAPMRNVEAARKIGGLELLHAQAQRQHELFMRVFDGL